MPRLLVFAPCERVIISSEDNSASLIALLHSVKLETKEDAPEKVVAPLSWSAFALWYKVPTDEGVEYEQRVELVSPSGAVLLEQKARFKMTKQYHRNTHRNFGLPILDGGDHVLRLSLRRVDIEDDFQVINEFPWPIQRVTSPASLRV